MKGATIICEEDISLNYEVYVVWHFVLVDNYRLIPAHIN